MNDGRSMTAARGVVYRTKRIGPKTGFDQKDMMKTNRGLYQKGQNRAAICEGECYDR